MSSFSCLVLQRWCGCGVNHVVGDSGPGDTDTVSHVLSRYPSLQLYTIRELLNGELRDREIAGSSGDDDDADAAAAAPSGTNAKKEDDAAAVAAPSGTNAKKEDDAAAVAAPSATNAKKEDDAAAVAASTGIDDGDDAQTHTKGAAQAKITSPNPSSCKSNACNTSQKDEEKTGS